MGTYAVCFAIWLGGALVQALSGFGFGIFTMSLLPFVMPSYSLAVAVTTISSIFGAGPIAFQRRKDLHLKLLWTPLIGFLISNTISVYFLYRQPEAILFRLLGVLLLLLSAYFAFFSKRIRIKPSPVSGAIAGLVSGVMNGLFSMGGPPVVVYFLAATENEREYLAATLTFFTITNTYSLIMRLFNGGITVEALPYAALSIVATLIIAAFNHKIDGKISGATIRKAVYCMMAVSGLILLLK